MRASEVFKPKDSGQVLEVEDKHKRKEKDKVAVVSASGDSKRETMDRASVESCSLKSPLQAQPSTPIKGPIAMMGGKDTSKQKTRLPVSNWRLLHDDYASSQKYSSCTSASDHAEIARAGTGSSTSTSSSTTHEATISNQ